MNLGEDGFGCCTVDGLKPVRVGLVFGEAVTRRGFDTDRSESFFVIILPSIPYSVCDVVGFATRIAFFPTEELGGLSLFAFNFDVSVNGVEYAESDIVEFTVFGGSNTA